MKIAIQGHPTRGKEVIQILESLGGKNYDVATGIGSPMYYFINNNGDIDLQCQNRLHDYNLYTLEEFEKEFPFKIGDKVKYITSIAIIKEYCYINNEPAYKVESMELGIVATIPTKLFEPYKEMEIRNITLTLEKAKEWYKKGGELKEVALQAYSEEELTKVELPKTWEEFCESYPVREGECWLGEQDKILNCSIPYGIYRRYKNWIPSKKSAEAHLAMIQLEQLRDCYNDNSDAWGWSYSIIKRSGIPELVRGCDHDTFLRFKNEEIAIQFLKNFKDLIEKAGDLI